ncbi:MAG: hypothetical protein ACRENA_07805, partial [Vulcanimicrobiaceae bacterium]
MLSLALLALVALGISLLLAIAAMPRARIITPPVGHGIVATPANLPIQVPQASTIPAPVRTAAKPTTALLEPLLIPWAIGIDALALLGLAVV